MSELYKKLKSIEPFSLSFHSDADGVFSAALLASAFKIRNAMSPELFGDYETDVAVDLGAPLNKDWKGIIIDHHDQHEEHRNYDLYFGYVPTGRIIYDWLKDHIPKEHLWKMAGSVTGDGQPELIPAYIWDTYKFLTDERGTLYTRYGKTTFTPYFVYSLLPSAINALCRLGNPIGAYKIAISAMNANDILDNQDVIDAKERVRKEIASIEASRPVVHVLRNKFAFIIISPTRPEIKLEGVFASKLASGMYKYTAGVINEKSGKVSIRGTFALYLAQKLAEKDLAFGGHPGYCGGYIEPDRIDELINIIEEVLK